VDESVWHSPLEGRYTCPALAHIWSETNKHKLWHVFWADQILILFTHGDIDLTAEDVQVLCPIARGEEGAGSVLFSVERSKQFEKSTHHDLAAGLQAFAASLPGRLQGYVHLGLTSSDVEDYADWDRIGESLVVITGMLREVIIRLTAVVKRDKDVPIMGRTHLQLAEPTLLGYRLSVPLELLVGLAKALDRIVEQHRDLIKTQTGAVGTSSNMELVGVRTIERTSLILATGQIYPRVIDLDFAYLFNMVAAVTHKLGLDMRLMSTEPWMLRKTDGIGSSAMPGKINPIGWEKVCSLSRMVPNMTNNMWDVAANSALERTLDDSAARRFLPELFMVMAQILTTVSGELIGKWVVSDSRALEQIRKEWRAWLPSRALAWLQANGKVTDRAKTHADLGYSADPEVGCETAGEYWYKMTGRPLMGEDTAEDLLCLSTAGRMTQSVINLAAAYLGTSDEARLRTTEISG
jgi:adenylosuccinate lyase